MFNCLCEKKWNRLDGTYIDGLQSEVVIERVVDHLGQAATEVVLQRFCLIEKVVG